MARKVRRRRKVVKYDLMEEQRLYESLYRAMEDLKGFYMYTNSDYMDMCQRIRTMNRPFVFDNYCDFGNSRYPVYDPTPFNMLDRAVAGILTYHVTPKDDFLELYRPLQGTTETLPNEVKEKAKRTKMIHSILQMPDNIVTEAKVHYDKILFNISGKRLRLHDDKFITSHYPPEDLALGSSDGIEPNIFGTIDRLDPFAAFSQLPEPLNKKVAKHWEQATLGTKNKREYWNLTLPSEVLLSHLELWFKSREGTDIKDYKEFFKRKMRKQWTTVTWSDYGIASIESTSERDTVITTSIPSPGRSLLSKGLGERALPLVVELAEKMEIDITAYERLMAPPVAIPSEAENYGLNLQRDGIIYTPSGTGEVKFVTPPINFQTSMPYGQKREEQLKQTYMLDIFEILEKVNMPTTEVNYRKDQNLTKGTVYVITDEQSNLRPTVQYLNVYLDSKVTKENKWMGKKTQARYVSPLAQSLSATYLARVEKFLLSMVNIGKAKESFKDSDVYANYGKLTTSILDRVNLEDILNDEETQATEKQIRSLREQTSDDLNTQKALQAALANTRTERDLNQGQPEGGNPDGTGGQTQPGGGLVLAS